MKPLKALFTIAAVTCFYSISSAQDGQQLFRSNCASCHTIGKGRLVGPDLIGVHSKRDEQWLVKFIKSSQTMVKEGDPTAVQLYQEYNNVPMPDAFINEEEIKSVIAFIKSKSDESGVASSGSSAVEQAGNATGGPSTPTEAKTNLLNMFSFSEYLLAGICVLLLFVVWIMGKSIRSLTVELERKYNSDDYL